MLKDSTELRTLILYLDNNQIGDACARALSMMKDFTHLKDFTLCC